MSRFDPKPDVPYATCVTDGCGLVHATRQDMSDHHNATLAESPDRRSHRASIGNPSRAERIARELDQLAESAIENLIDEMWDLVERHGVTEEEVAEAARRLDLDVVEAWRESIDAA